MMPVFKISPKKLKREEEVPTMTVSKLAPGSDTKKRIDRILTPLEQKTKGYIDKGYIKSKINSRTIVQAPKVASGRGTYSPHIVEYDEAGNIKKEIYKSTFYRGNDKSNTRAYDKRIVYYKNGVKFKEERYGPKYSGGRIVKKEEVEYYQGKAYKTFDRRRRDRLKERYREREEKITEKVSKLKGSEELKKLRVKAEMQKLPDRVAKKQRKIQSIREYESQFKPTTVYKERGTGALFLARPRRREDVLDLRKIARPKGIFSTEEKAFNFMMKKTKPKKLGITKDLGFSTQFSPSKPQKNVFGETGFGKKLKQSEQGMSINPFRKNKKNKKNPFLI